MSMPQASWLQHPHAKRIGFVLLFYLFGPMVLRAHHIWRDTAGPKWHAEIRWERTFGSALLSLLWYVPIVLLASPLGSFWASIFATLAQWFHFAPLALLGGTAFYLPIPGTLLLRWFLAYPLSGVVACGLEMFWPRTTWQSKRVLTADEQVLLTQQVAAEEKKRLKAPRSTSTEAGQAKKKRQPRAKVQPEQTVPVTPSADSLWGQINWNAVPDSNPLKKEALAARTEQQALRSQPQQTRPAKNTQTPKRSEQRTPPQIIESKPAPPVAYNWDEGEGSIRE